MKVRKFLNNLSVRTKVSVLLITVIAVVMAVIGATLAAQTSERVNNQIRERLQNKASASIGIFETVRIHTLWILNAAANMPQVHDALQGGDIQIAKENISAFFESIIPEGYYYEQLYTNMYVFDSSFNLLLSADPGRPSVDLLVDDFSENIRRAQAGLSWVSPVVEDSGVMYILFTEPVMADNQFLGITALLIDTAGLASFLHEPTYGYDSFVNIADDAGSIFFSNRPAYIGRHVDDLGVVEALGFIPFNTIFHHNSAITGIDKIAYITTAGDEHFLWTVVSFFDADAVENVVVTIITSLLPVFIGMTLASVVMIWIIRWALKPLDRLTVSAKKVAAGDLAVNFEIERNDEIAQVARSFLEIVKSINILQENFIRAESFVARGDLSYKLQDTRLEGVYEKVLSMTNNVIREFQKFLELISEPIIVIDRKLHVKYANKSTRTLTENEQHSVFIDDFIRGNLSIFLEKSLESGTPLAGTDIQLELNKDKHFDLELSCIPFEIDGNVEGAILILINVTHIKEMQRSMEHAKLEAEAANRAKSDFLSRMSHEIRTPMNAIMGMAELILRDDVTNTVRDQTITIKQSSIHLLSIVNDILDFSKIESGKMEILSTEYIIYSVVSDVISIVNMRLAGSNARFVVYVHPDIPKVMYGDEVRIRQVLLNLLTNAVKFTTDGYISLDITADPIDDDNLLLVMKIRDTGIGIKQEDLSNLFGEFNQFDVITNRNVEGTGLGLAITKNLVNMMGGNISVSSEYGVGSEFTITIPQRINTEESENVFDFDGTTVLYFGHTPVYEEYLTRCLKDLDVTHHILRDESELYTKLRSNTWTFIFAESKLAFMAENIVNEHNLNTRVVMFTDSAELSRGQTFSTILMPAYFLPIANLLSLEENLLYDGFSDNQLVFAAPEAKVLVVDDIETNLHVAKGMLAIFGIDADICLSGKEAIEAVKILDYDLVFMDHMMPEMDGVEVCKFLRGLEGEKYSKLPIVALTANAIISAKEMFMQNGFNDFLSKPIELPKLSAILSKWIPESKQKHGAIAIKDKNEAPVHVKIEIENVNTEKGIARSGGSFKSYLSILEVFHKDAQKKLEDIASTFQQEDISLYTTYVHALKSASANIGAWKLSEEARILEAAALKHDMEFVKKYTKSFLRGLEKTIADIGTALENFKPQAAGPEVETDVLNKTLIDLKTALDEFDLGAIDEISQKLESFNSDESISDFLSDILQTALIGDYEQASEKIAAFLPS